ncbi:MAG: hypothetical protein WCJ37_03625 [Syntrophus sp. (in: bacteria)]
MKAGRGRARRGKAWQVRLGVPGPGGAGFGKAWQAWRGKTRPGRHGR